MSGSSLVAITLIREEQLSLDFATLPVESYLPVFLHGENNDANIAKRLDLIYFRKDPTIIKIKWAYRGQESMYTVIDNPHLNKPVSESVNRSNH